MTTDAELVAYAIALEKRVDRLKTLEEDPPATAGVWTFITSQELAIATASMTFLDIPQTYDDLMVIYRAKTARAFGQDYLVAQFNADTVAGNYDTARSANNSTNTCYQDSGWVMIGVVLGGTATGDADDMGVGICYIPEYTNTGKKLSIQSRGGAHGQTAVFGLNGLTTGAWSMAGYPAVTSIKFFAWSAANLQTDTLIELYGLTR